MTPLRPTHPFPGLRPFKYEESQLFFGRDGQVEKMIAKLSAKHFLGVVGTSGSGKSSLVFAGLLPALRSGMMPGVGSNWRIAVMRPGDDPIGNLARALNDPKVFGPPQPEYNRMQAVVTEITLRRGSRGLCECMQQNCLPHDPTKNLLVVVDQFEELFRYTREARRANNDKYADDAAAFVKLLLEAVKPTAEGGFAQPLYVLLTMRSDFLGDCAQFWELPEAINESQYLIPRLTRDQLREVIEGPIALCDGQITSRLVNHLLNDVGDRQDQLPILQHALMRTWDYWIADCGSRIADSQNTNAQTLIADLSTEATVNPQSIDLPHFEAVGGLEHALSNHADEAYAELDERLQQIAKRVFQCLTEKGEDSREIRRPVELQKLCDVAQASLPEVVTVIEAFRAPGRSFLMPLRNDKPELQPETQIDISHECLIRVWQRLRQWVSEEAEAATMYRRLADVAQRRALGKAEALSGVDLDAALQWQTNNQPLAIWAERYQLDFASVSGLLEDSQAVRVANEAKQRAATEEKEVQRRAVAVAEERQRHGEREIARTRKFAAILGIAFLLAMGLAAYSFLQRREAVRQRAEAERQRLKVESSDKFNSQLAPIYYELLFQGDDPVGRFEAARKLFHQSGDVLGEGVALASIGDSYYRLQDYAEAAKHYQKSLDRLNQTVPDHAYVARVLNKLAAVYTDQGKFEQAAPLFTQARAMLEKTFGPNNIEVSANLSGQAKLLQQQKKYEQAEALFIQARDINQRVLGADHQLCALNLSDLATLYAAWGKPDRAEPLFTQAIKLLEARLGSGPMNEQHIKAHDTLYHSLAIIYQNQAVTYYQQGDVAKAAPLFKRALDIHEKLLGPGHLKVAHAKNNLATMYFGQTKFSEALILYDQAAPVYESIFGEADERTLQVRQGLDAAKAKLAQSPRK
jgi:tetratricopeptide (TPR) repeat protein